MARAGTAYIDFQGDFSSLRRQVATEASRAGRTFSSAFGRQQASNLRAIGSAAKYAALGLGGLSAFYGAQAVREGLQFNATMESNELALARFTGGSKEARKYLDDLYKLAKKTPFEFTDLTTASRRLLAFGLSAEKTQRVLSATGDAIAAMGGGAENIDRVTMALGQMQSKGRVSAEELLQLTEAGIPAYKILQEELNLTSDQVADIGNQGIQANEAIAALTRGMEKEFAGAAKQQAKTFDGQISTLKDNYAQALGAMTEGLFNTLKDDWLPAVNQTAEAIARIWNRKDLSPEQQFRRSFAAIERNLGPLLERLAQGLDEADIGQKILDGVEWAIPRIAENAGQLGLMLAKGIVEGFREADVIGKILIGLAVARYGFGVKLSTIGSKMGSTIGRGVMSSFLARVAGPAGIAAILINELEGEGSETLGRMMEQRFLAVAQAWDISQKQARQLVAYLERNPGLGVPEALAEMEAARKAKLEPFREAVHRLEVGFHDSLESISKSAERNMEKVENSFGRHSKRGKALLAANMDASVKAIERAMELGQIKSDKGLLAINELIRKRLALYGIKGDSAEKIIRAQQRPEDVRGLQRGGSINEGRPSGDSVPAMLERGEYVLNRNAVKAIGKGALDQVNFGMAKRFAKGGIVPAPGFPGERINKTVIPAFQSLVKRFDLFLTDAYGPGHQSPEHTQYGTAIDVIPGAGGSWDKVGQAVRYSVRKGYTPVYYDGSNGSINLPPHGPGHHAHITLLTAAELLSGKHLPGGSAGMAKLNLPRFESAFPMFVPAAEQLNLAAEAIEAKVGRAIARTAGMEGPEIGAGIGDVRGNGAALMRAISKQRGWNFADWWELDRRESSHGTNLVNPTSTARLRGQFLDFNWGKYGPGSDPRQNPSMREQIISMARYIAERYGNPSAALAHHNAHNWYQRGGIVGMQKGGDPDEVELTATGTRRSISKRLMERLKLRKSEIARLGNILSDYEIAHATPFSASGEELSPGERNLQLAFAKSVLSNQVDYREALRRAISLTGRAAGKKYRDSLTELVGPTGDAGTLLDTKMKIYALENPEQADQSESDSQRADILASLLAESNRENAILRAQTPIFERLISKAPFGGIFHQGGVVPGPVGQERTIIASGGETITPPGAPVEVTLVVNDGAVNPNAIDVRVNDRLATIARHSTPRGGVIGRRAAYR